MGIKSDTAKPATTIPEKPASTITPAPKPEPVTAVVTNGDGASKTAPLKKKPVKKAAKKKPVKLSTDDIALRAYFISENRQQHGIHGDSHSDWLQAERQLKAERRKAAQKKPALKKKWR